MISTTRKTKTIRGWRAREGLRSETEVGTNGEGKVHVTEEEYGKGPKAERGECRLWGEPEYLMQEVPVPEGIQTEE